MNDEPALFIARQAASDIVWEAIRTVRVPDEWPEPIRSIAYAGAVAGAAELGRLRMMAMREQGVI